VQFTIKKRPVGGHTSLGRLGHPQVTTPTGGTLDIVTGASDPGFNPLDLLYSSLSACLALSTRIAASRMGLLDRFENVEVDVTGEKADAEPSRILSFTIQLKISGDFDDETRSAIAHMAEDICTVSNTLRADSTFHISVAG
jgi:uncharacterized OsmC-like protein